MFIFIDAVITICQRKRGLDLRNALQSIASLESGPPTRQRVD